MAQLTINGTAYDLGDLTVADYDELRAYGRGKGVDPATLLQELERMHGEFETEAQYLVDERFGELLDVVLFLVWLGVRAHGLDFAQRLEAAGVTDPAQGVTRQAWAIDRDTIRHFYLPAQVVAGLRSSGVRTWLRNALGAELPAPKATP